MRRFNARWGSFQGIEGLPLIIVASNAVVFLFDLFQPGLTALLQLSPAAVRAGQWWRLFTYLFVPPAFDQFLFFGVQPPFNIILLFFWLGFLYTMASSLERAWGTFRFTLYYLSGAAATAAVGLLPVDGLITNGYLNASLFLAFAALFPDVEVLLFLVFPVKVRWLGWLTWFWIGLELLAGGNFQRGVVAAGLVNYFLLLGPDLWEKARLRLWTFRNRRRWKGPL